MKKQAKQVYVEIKVGTEWVSIQDEFAKAIEKEAKAGDLNYEGTVYGKKGLYRWLMV